MKRLMLVALLALVLVIGNLVTVPRETTPASGCVGYASGISKGTASRCPMPWWRQGPSFLA